MKNDASELIDKFGGFHDASVNSIHFDIVNSKILISLDDINANYRGIDGFPPNESDPATISIKFETINFSLDMNTPDLKIYDCEMLNTLNSTLKLMFAPSGFVEVKFNQFNVIS